MWVEECADEDDLSQVVAQRFRVRFWTNQQTGVAETLTEFTLGGTDSIGEVLAWANERASGRWIEIFIEHPELRATPHGVQEHTTLVKVHGQPRGSAAESRVRFTPGSPPPTGS